jgi:hypothetical protein
MDPKLRKLIIFSILIAALIYGYSNIPKKQQPAEPGPGETDPMVQPAQIVQKSKLVDIEKYSALPWERDPFTRSFQATTDITIPSISSEWELGGILFDETNPTAIINSRIVKAGEMIDGARVLKIDKSKVLLERNGNPFALSIKRDES